MRTFFAITIREVAENRLVLATAVAGSILALLVPLARGLDGPVLVEAQTLAAGVTSLAIAGLLSLVLGATLFPSGSSIHKLGFYFSRPIHGGVIWAAKMAGAAFLLACVVFIVMVPAWMLALRAGRTDTVMEMWAAVLLVVVALYAIPVVHSLQVFVRARSFTLALDALAVLAAAAAIVLLDIRFAHLHANHLADVCQLLLAILAALGVVCASVFALAYGRLSTHASHRVASSLIWVLMGVGMVAVWGYSVWVAGVRVGGLEHLTSIRPVHGTWVLVDGHARGVDHAFLYDLDSHSSFKIGRLSRYSLTTSGNSWVMWQEYRVSGVRFLLADLSKEKPEVVSTGIRESFFADDVFLSPDGSRMATIIQGTLSIYEIGQSSPFSLTQLHESRFQARGFFLDGQQIRIYRYYSGQKRTHSSFDVLNHDMETGETDLLWSLEGSVLGPRIQTSRDGRYVAIQPDHRQPIRLFDANSGDELAELANESASRFTQVGFLNDGRILVNEVKFDLSQHLVQYSPSGEYEQSFQFPTYLDLKLGCEVAPGVVLVGTSPEYRDPMTTPLYSLDVDAGDFVVIADDLQPVCRAGRYASDDPLGLPLPGSEPTTLLKKTRSSEFLRLDPGTGELERLTTEWD